MTTPSLMTGLPQMRPALGTKGCWPQERGSATVVMLGVVATVLTLTVSGLWLVSAALASHRARAAADLGALAAASALIQGESASAACASATRVVVANHARLRQCLVSGTEVRLVVAVAAGMTGLGVATARSRAGPSAGAIS